jgi:opacity protein-like surface antigen
MRPYRLGCVGVAAVLALAGAGHAAADDPPLHAAELRLPSVPGITWEIGKRTWYSTGRLQKDLFDTTGSVLVSQLTYEHLSGISAEVYFRADHRSGAFAKGYIGGGSVSGGKMNDEDFPPVTVPYSNTRQEHEDGSLVYGSIDLGYMFWQRRGFYDRGGPNGEAAFRPSQRLGAFLGYHHWRERLNTYGCTDVSAGLICDPAIPTTQNTLDNEAVWRSLRLGLIGETEVGPRVKVTGELAYVRSWLDNRDFHNLRRDLDGLKEDGTGNGVQAEIIVAYQVSEALSLGLGARWWHLETSDGDSHFEDTPGGGSPQVVKFNTDRYGVFLQGSYKLSGSARRAGSLKDANVGQPYMWNGLYAGLSSGYGWGAAEPRITADSAAAGTSLAIGDVPSGMSYDAAGYVSGGQAGYNVHLGTALVGVEVDLNLARIAGTGSVTGTPNTFNTTIDQGVDWFGAVRGRLGLFPATNVMLFAAGGVAYGETRLDAAVVGPVGTACTAATTCSVGSNSGISVGWTAGAGFEYALPGNLTLKGEYLFVDLGDRSLRTRETATGGSPPYAYAVRSDFDFHLVRFGVNYRFQ